MTISLYMDENVFGAITKGLRRRQVEVLTVQEDGRSGYPDPMILDRQLNSNEFCLPKMMIFGLKRIVVNQKGASSLESSMVINWMARLASGFRI